LQLENGVSWLRWWDESGNLLLTGDERALQAEAIVEQQKAIAEHQKAIAEQERAIAEQERQQKLNEREQKLQERQQKEKLANYLRSIGIDPDAI
jgi:hypothetical protein